MPSTTSDASHLRHVNVTATSTSSTGIIIPPPARDGDGIGIAAFGRIFFAVIFATYVFLGLIYLIKIHVVSRLIVGSRLARRGGREIITSSSSSSSSSTDASSSFSSTHDRSRSSRGILSSSSLRCTDLIFAIRLFLHDIITSSDDGRDHGGHRASGGSIILSRHEYYSDERCEYRSWSVTQVARWAHMRLHRDRQREKEEESLTLRTTRARGMSSYCDSPRDEYKERMAIRTAITALQDQRIHGKSLEYLTLDRLLEFGLAFGVAVNLMSCLDELIRANDDNNNRLNHDANEEEVALGRFPTWYEGSRVDNTKENDISVGDEEMELTERARRIMKDRFGLTLPTLRCQDEVPSNEIYHPENDSQRCTSGGNSSSKICQDGTTMIALNNGTSNDWNTNTIPLARGRPTAYVIDEMISSMPPHVRAVAERRPDLMSKLFTEREEPHSSVLRQSQSHRRTTVVDTPCVLGEDISLQSEDRVSIDQESVCLLRRRTNNGKLDASS